MERSEPTLVPEWLKSTGSLTGSGSTAHHLSSSDEHNLPLHTRNRSSVSNSEYDSSRSTFSDRSSSNYSRRSSCSNGSIHDKDISSYSRSYSSFSRSHRDRDREKDLLDLRDKDRSVLGDYRVRDYFDPLDNILTGRIEKDTLRRSQSMISGKRGEGWLRRVAADSNNGSNNSNNHSNSDGLPSGGTIVSSIHKAAFERDFPSLGVEERQAGADIGRVSSPGLSTAVQSLPIATSAVIGGDSWTSALAEVPVIIGSNSMGLSSVQQSAPVTSSSVVSSTSTGLNMAETLAQAPARARTAPQLSVETQRLEELAIKQSRQLIPMMPSMPKASVLSPSEKPKPKISAVRTGESSMAIKIGQQQLPSSHLVNHSLRGGAVRSDVPKTSHGGKLLVLKAPREKNGVSPTAKDGLSPTNASRVVNNPLAVAPCATVAPPLKSPSNPKLGTAERKAPSLSVIHGPSVEKRTTTAQAQSRNDFFNLMRKKTSINLSSAVPDVSPSVSSSVLEKSSDLVRETATTLVSPQCCDAPSSDPSAVDWSSENGGDITNNGGASESRRFSDNGDKHSGPNEVVYPDEEEAAFLRSLGWEENAGEEEGLTEEEINAFYKEYMKLRPSSKLCRGMQKPQFEPHVGSLERGSSGLSSSDSESEA
ncbi:uncharacterized protein LOC122077939 [Macadamia integrifolia]|uniref:uncharacterized protein LOC122077939 n=1 Tax=Macadamia integrifolia TaxID=60698 RepID=UPI001C50015E|nr:uncharacterized protein LOC122077939 [Macadamia integrifolia]